MDRLYQALLIVGTLGFSWLGMMAVHELGHVIHVWASGGAVRQIVLPLLGFSRTDVSLNPHPLLVARGGALWGAILPLVLLLAVRRFGRRFAFLAAFFAGFCLIANGAYLAGGAWINAGDAADLLHLGASRWQLLGFGLPAIAVGLLLLNGLGPNFGLAQPHGRVDRRAALLAASACIAIVLADLLIGLLQTRI
jgi:hypothetical protein